MITTELYQVLTLVLVVISVDLLERYRPGYRVDRKRELGLNILALVVVIVAGELWKEVLQRGFNAIRLDYFLSLHALRTLPSGSKLFLSVVAADFSLYWVHRAMHRQVLWRTHAFHHSIPEIWWLAGSRTSVTHLLLFAVPQVLIAYSVLGLTPHEAGIGFSFGVVVNIWIHTNISVDLGPLEWVFITPDFHRIHHAAKGYRGKNLAFVFTVWDRMFGTYENPREVGKDLPVLAVPTRNRLFRMIVGF